MTTDVDQSASIWPRLRLMQLILLVHALAGTLFALRLFASSAAPSSPVTAELSDDGIVGVISLGRKSWIFNTRGELLSELHLGGERMEFSSDDRHLGIVTLEGIHVFEVANGRRIAYFRGHNFTFSPDGHDIALLDFTADVKTKLEVHGISSGVLKTSLRPNSDQVPDHFHNDCLAYSKDGAILASGASDYSTFNYALTLWNVASGEVHALLTGDKAIDDVRFSGDGGRVAVLAAGGGNGRLTVQEVSSGRLLTVFDEFSPIASDFAFTDDGKMIALAWGKNVGVWEIGSSVEKIFATQKSADVASVAIRPDQSELIALSKDGALSVWNIRNGNLTREVSLGQATSELNWRAMLPWWNLWIGGGFWVAVWLALRLVVRPSQVAVRHQPNKALLIAAVAFEATNLLPLLSPMWLISSWNAFMLAVNGILATTFVVTGVSWYLMGFRFHALTFVIGSIILGGGFWICLWVTTAAIASV